MKGKADIVIHIQLENNTCTDDVVRDFVKYQKDFLQFQILGNLHKLEPMFLWAAMPESCKTATSLVNFKTGLKSFTGIQCKCRACKFTNNVF